MVRLHRSSLLRRVLLADALVSGATGLLMFSGATLLTRVLALPETLLRYAGIVLLPYAACVAYVATRQRLHRTAVWAVIGINALWAADSMVLLLTGWIAPNVLGYGFVLIQAIAVAIFAALQYLGVRKLAALTV